MRDEKMKARGDVLLLLLLLLLLQWRTFKDLLLLLYVASSK